MFILPSLDCTRKLIKYIFTTVLFPCRRCSAWAMSLPEHADKRKGKRTKESHRCVKPPCEFFLVACDQPNISASGVSLCWLIMVLYYQEYYSIDLKVQHGQLAYFACEEFLNKKRAWSCYGERTGGHLLTHNASLHFNRFYTSLGPWLWFVKISLLHKVRCCSFSGGGSSFMFVVYCLEVNKTVKYSARVKGCTVRRKVMYSCWVGMLYWAI